MDEQKHQLIHVLPAWATRVEGKTDEEGKRAMAENSGGDEKRRKKTSPMAVTVDLSAAEEEDEGDSLADEMLLEQ